MSLRGTLGDFGIADIFQLIGHQAKTGVLHLKDREIEVRISFVEGNVVKAEQSSRDKADLLGNIMVRARVLSQAQLDDALAQQQRTMRRLGDILVELAAVDRATLKEFARLQTTETIYRVFSWKAGTYEFQGETVDYDEQSYEPIRSENLLMEGFRMVDEWPAIRRIIPNNGYSFVQIKALPPPGAVVDEDDDLLAGLDDALSGNGESSGPKARAIGEAERGVFPFVAPGVTVADIVDVSRIGEFETTKALATLVTNGVLGLQDPVAASTDEGNGVRTLLAAELRPFAIRVALFALLAGLVFGLTKGASVLPSGLLSPSAGPDGFPAGTSSPWHALQDAVGVASRHRLGRAIEVARVEQGAYPELLEVVANRQLVEARDLRVPYADPWAYRRTSYAAFEAPPPPEAEAPTPSGKGGPKPPKGKTSKASKDDDTPVEASGVLIPTWELALPLR